MLHDLPSRLPLRVDCDHGIDKSYLCYYEVYAVFFSLIVAARDGCARTKALRPGLRRRAHVAHIDATVKISAAELTLS